MHSTAKALFLLTLLSVSWSLCSASASTEGGRKGRPRVVKNKSDLWRFQVGQSAPALTIGSSYLCLLSYRTQFLASRSGKTYNDRDWCKGEERFAVEFLEDGKVTLQPMLSDWYVSCMDNGDAILQKDVTDKQKWELKLNADDDQLSFYNTMKKKFLVAKNDGSVRCDGTSRGSSALFLGWKMGPQSAWEPKEEGRFVRKFSNAKGKSVRTFKFKKTLGIKKVKDSEAKTRVDEPLGGGGGLARKFKTKFESPLQTDWSKEDKVVWKEATTVDATWDVEPNMIVTLYQAVGMFGPLEIYSDHIMAKEEEAGEPQAQTLEV